MRTRADNSAAKAKLLEVHHRIREMTAKNAELSVIAAGACRYATIHNVRGGWDEG